MTASRFATLTRHFVGVILAPPLLTELGADYLRRTLSSIAGMLLVAGVFLPRAFFYKYVVLTGEIRPTNFERSLQADTLLMIAVPMLIVGLIAVVLSPMMFPDETDYQVLTPLPVTRGEIFAARLCALAAVAAVAVLAINAITSIWFPFVSGGRRAHYPLSLRVSAHGAAATLASAWTVSAIMALQGLCLTLSPQRWRRRLSLLVQGSVLLALLLSLPFVWRLPTADVSAATVQLPPLVWLPPVWFYNVEQWLLTGASAEQSRAASALWACITTIATVVASYTWLYRSAERLADVSGDARSRASATIDVLGGAQLRGLIAPATAAVLAFSCFGLLRSRLQQIVLLLIVGVGVAIAIGQVTTVVEGATLAAARPRAVVHAALAAPLLIALSITMALRTVFLLPIDRDAAWIVRLVEMPEHRSAALDGVAHLLRWTALAPAAALAVVLQPRVLDARWPLALVLTLLAVLVLIEIVLVEWARIPYTCSYLPGKRVMAYTLGVLFAAYAIFVYLGARTISWAIVHPSRMLVVSGILLVALAVLRWARLRTWGRLPLEFEDEDPTEPHALGLLPDEH